MTYQIVTVSNVKRSWNYNDLTGKKFGKLFVVNRVYYTDRKGCYYRCKCDCGNEVDVKANHLKGGQRQCKKCMPHDNSTKHGLHGHPSYRTWVMMRQRCENPNAIGYKNYGGRGIIVCERWSQFENFVEDVGCPPSSAHTLDRYPNMDGNYAPDNFRWATHKEQMRNKRNNRIVEYDGKSLTLAEWSEKTNISSAVLFNRIKLGWDIYSVFNKGIRQSERIIEFNGLSLTVKEWSKRLELNKSTINSRIHKKWPLEKVFSKESFKSGVCPTK